MQILTEVYGWITLEFSSCLETGFIWEESRGTSAFLLKIRETVQGFFNRSNKRKELCPFEARCSALVPD